MSNTAYYAAERALRNKIAACSERELREILDKMSVREDADFNRVMFGYFGVTEATAKQEG